MKPLSPGLSSPPEVEKDVLGLAGQQLALYGMTIARLGNFNISLARVQQALVSATHCSRSAA